MPYRLTQQRRLSVYNPNPGPRRGKEGAVERHIAGIWHIITLQEAVGYLGNDLLANRCHVTHFGGCAILFNVETFFSDIKASSIYLHDTRACEQDKIKEGESGWVLQGVVSRASFRRQPRSGQNFFTVMSLHINNNFAKKRGIGKKLLLTVRAIMLEKHVDLVAGDFNRAAWGQTCGNNPQPSSILEEAFADTDFPMPPDPPPLWGPGAVPGEWTDVCGFVEPPHSCEKWKVRLHGVFTIAHETVGLRPRDQSCHHAVWLYLDFVGRQCAREPRGNHEQRVLLKERSCPYPPNKERQVRRWKRQPLSSLSSVRELILPQAAGMTRQGHPFVNR